MDTGIPYLKCFTVKNSNTIALPTFCKISTFFRTVRWSPVFLEAILCACMCVFVCMSFGTVVSLPRCFYTPQAFPFFIWDPSQPTPPFSTVETLFNIWQHVGVGAPGRIDYLDEHLFKSPRIPFLGGISKRFNQLDPIDLFTAIVFTRCLCSAKGKVGIKGQDCFGWVCGCCKPGGRTGL